MAPRKVQISQEAFDGAVKENMEEFEMELAEAVEDAIKTFQLQGADLSAYLETELKKFLKKEMDNTAVEHEADGITEMPVGLGSDVNVSPAHEIKNVRIVKHDLEGKTCSVKETNDALNDNEHENPPVASDEGVAVATGIVTDGSNIGKANYVHPAVECVKELEQSLALLRLETGSFIDWEAKQKEPARVEALFEAAVDALKKFSDICCKREAENAQIAVKNGGVEVSIDAYRALKTYRLTWGTLAFKVLFSLLTDDQGKQRFLNAEGPEVVLEALAMEDKELYEGMNREIACTAATVLALAATKSEAVKERFIDLGADTALVRYLKNHAEEEISDGAALQAACDAIRSLIVADDDRPAASKAYGNAMKIAKAGAVDAILEVLPQRSKATPILPTLCITLKSLAVNDEICRGVAEEGGLDMVLEFLDYSIKHPNKVVARSACALLSQLANSDTNKDAIVQSGGLNKLVNLMNAYNEEPSVLQEGFAAIATLTLRSPQNATKAVEAGAVDIAAELMEKHTGAASMLRQACQMIRNLSVRNLENRPIILEKGLEPLLRKAKDMHESCKDVGSAALRDLGLDNYQ